MRSMLIALIMLTAAALPARADNEFEDLLILKFKTQNQSDVGTLRKQVADAAVEAGKLKDIDPDRGIEILRDIRNRMDKVKLMTIAERRSLNDVLQPLVLELRDASLLKRREKASLRLDAFRDFLVVGAYEGRFPGRSGGDRWEPANFTTPDGESRLGKLVHVTGAGVVQKSGEKEITTPPPLFPIIQVFGGFYVFDRATNHHVFFTNREFYNFVWEPLRKRYLEDESLNRPPVPPNEALRVPDPKLLDATIASGTYFLRGLPVQEPIRGIGSFETPFLDYVAITIATKGLPIDLNRVYPRDLQDRLMGLSEIQWSAAHRAVVLMQSRDISVSPLFAEILREETDKLLRSEYANFSQIESNRAILYIFSKLK